MDGALDLDELREMVAGTPTERKLLKKIQDEESLEEFIIMIMDGLRERLAEGIRKDTVIEELDAFLDA